MENMEFDFHDIIGTFVIIRRKRKMCHVKIWENICGNDIKDPKIKALQNLLQKMI